MGLFVCGILTGVVALVLANQATQKINASGGRLTGTGLVKAARIIAIIAIVLSILGLADPRHVELGEHVHVVRPAPAAAQLADSAPAVGAAAGAGRRPVRAAADGRHRDRRARSSRSSRGCSARLIAAVVALVLAHVAGNKIDASGGRLTGGGIVRAAQIIAWIHIVLVTIVMVALAIALAANDSSSDSLRASARSLG